MSAERPRLASAAAAACDDGTPRLDDSDGLLVATGSSLVLPIDPTGSPLPGPLTPIVERPGFQRPHQVAGRRDRHRHGGFPPHDLDLAVATFLIKILDPVFFVRKRPDRASPRRTKKAGDLLARKPNEPSVVTVTRRIQLHSLRPRPSG